MIPSTYTLRAPGKAMLLGEYVVLDGAPALVAAVTRHAVGQLTTKDPSGVIRIHSDLHDTPWTLRSETGEIHAAPHASFALVEAVYETLIAADVALPASGCELFLSSSELSSDTKLGLGSSAAIAAITTLALAGEVGTTLPTDAAVHALTDAAHRRFQGGVGSGSDVAAACFGGILRMSAGEPPRRVDRFENSRHIGGLLHPADENLLVVYTGYAANTRDFVRSVRAQAHHPDVQRALHAMRDAAEMGVSSFEGGEYGAFLDAVRRFHRAECALTNASQVPIVTNEIATAVDIFERAGGVGKASGAGGGDIVLGFFPSREERRAAEVQLQKTSLQVVDLSIETRGVLETSGLCAN